MFLKRDATLKLSQSKKLRKNLLQTKISHGLQVRAQNKIYNAIPGLAPTEWIIYPGKKSLSNMASAHSLCTSSRNVVFGPLLLSSRSPLLTSSVSTGSSLSPFVWDDYNTSLIITVIISSEDSIPMTPCADQRSCHCEQQMRHGDSGDDGFTPPLTLWGGGGHHPRSVVHREVPP